MIVTASDLVPAAAITETTIRMKGVNATEDVPLANVRMNIGNRHFWVTAVVVKEPPSDVLLGRDCPELVNLLRVILCKECNDSPLTKVLVGTTHRQAQLAEKESDQDNISDVHIWQ